MPDVVLQPCMRASGPFSVEVPGAKPVPGETRPRRHLTAVDGLVTRPHPSIRTPYDIVRCAARTHGASKCVGAHTLLATHRERKLVNGAHKEQQYFELGPYQYLTFVEFQDHVGVLGSGLRQLGLHRGDNLHLCGATSLPWMSVAHAAFTQSLPIVTAYDTLGLDGLRSSLAQTASRAIFRDAALLPSLDKVLPDTASLEFLVLNGAPAAAVPDAPDVVATLRDHFPHIPLIPTTSSSSWVRTRPSTVSLRTQKI